MRVTLHDEGGAACPSRRFDMRCYRLMFDGMTCGDERGAAMAGLAELYDGILSADEIAAYPAETLSAALRDVLAQYRSIRWPTGGKRVVGGGHPIDGLYHQMLTAGHLPDAVDRQEPDVLFAALSERDGAIDAANLPPGARDLYML